MHAIHTTDHGASTFALVYYAGDTAEIRLTWRDHDHEPLDLTGTVATFVLKLSPKQPDAQAAMRYSTADGISYDDAPGGIMRISPEKADSDGLAVPAVYFASVVLYRDGKEITSAVGTVEVRRRGQEAPALS